MAQLNKDISLKFADTLSRTCDSMAPRLLAAGIGSSTPSTLKRMTNTCTIDYVYQLLFGLSIYGNILFQEFSSQQQPKINQQIITRARVQQLEIPTIYFLLFVTTEMLKHLNTEKSWMTSSLASQFSFFFFICLAITTDDIARHWESSSKTWATAITNQVMRHGVIHLRVTLTALPLRHRHASARTH